MQISAKLAKLRVFWSAINSRFKTINFVFNAKNEIKQNGLKKKISFLRDQRKRKTSYRQLILTRLLYCRDEKSNLKLRRNFLKLPLKQFCKNSRGRGCKNYRISATLG